MLKSKIKLSSMSMNQKQVVLLYISTLLGTVFGVLSSIVNTHFLAPEDYGDVRYVQNIINLIASLLVFGYFLSGSRLLALSDNEEYSRRIRGCMVVILVASSFVLLIGTWVNVFFHANKPSLASLFMVSLPVCLYPLLQNYVNTTAQGDNHIVRLSINRLLPSLIYVPLGYLLYSKYGSTSQKVVLLQWGIYTIISMAVIISTKPSFRKLYPVFCQLEIENNSYGKQLYYGSLIMVATNYIAGVTIGLFNDDNMQVGFYTLALTVTQPLMMLPAIIGTTYFKRFAHEDKIPNKVMTTTVFMTILSCVAFIVFIHPVVNYLYSERYAVVGVYASWLAIGSCVHGIGDMLNRYLGSHGQGKAIRNASFACGTFKIIGFSLFVYLWGIDGALLTAVISSWIYFLCMEYYYKKFIR